MNNGGVRVISLGGLTEIGSKNCYLVIDSNGNGILLDCGRHVGDCDDEDGTTENLNLMPNFSAIPDDVKRIVAVCISHGHLDHIGGINEFLKFYYHSSRFEGQPSPKIVGSSHTIRVIKMLEYHAMYKSNPPELEMEYAMHNPDDTTHDISREVKAGEDIFWDASTNILRRVTKTSAPDAEDIVIHAFKVNHSIPEALGFVVEVGGKKIVYTGDVKLHGKNQEETSAFARVLAQDKKIKNADLALVDATGSNKAGTGESDEIPIDCIIEVIENNPDSRVFVTTFSSHIDRIEGVMRRIKRPIILHGTSVIGHMKYARLNYPGKGGWSRYTYGRDEVPKNAVIFLTGSQGEELSALVRLINDEKYDNAQEDIHFSSKDVIIFAARAIPGNEHKVADMLRKLKYFGCKIFYPIDHCEDGQENCLHASWSHYPGWAYEAAAGRISFDRFHVSGHAYQQDLADILRAFNPKRVVPIHADRDRRVKMARHFSGRYEFIIAEEGEEIIV